MHRMYCMWGPLINGPTWRPESENDKDADGDGYWRMDLREGRAKYTNTV